MKPSQQITAARKTGNLEEAYQIAVDFLKTSPDDRWLKGAFGWVLIDLVKKHSSGSDQAALRRYTDELASLVVPEGDELLATHRNRWLASSTPSGKTLEEARTLSKAGKHEDAIRLYVTLASENALDEDGRVAFGWELFRALKSATGKDDSGKLDERNIGRIRQYLNMYFKLGISRPDLLHSCIMQQGIKVAKQGHLKFLPFLKIWKIDNLRKEDFGSTRSDDGREFPALAEDLIQFASKEACRTNEERDLEYLKPHLEAAIRRYPNNIWLKFNLAKLLRGLNQNEAALALAISFAKEKAGESWTWDLIGDLQSDPEMRLSCYAKALSCSDDDNFTGKIRLKFAQLLAASSPGEAKAEVERVISFKQKNSEKVPAEAAQMAQSPWFMQASSTATGRSFYDKHKVRAEEILFADIPWYDACLGDEFEIVRDDGSKRRKRRIYIRGNPIPLEISVSASHPEVRGKAPGHPLRLQKESPAQEPWNTKVHRIQPRPQGIDNDVLKEVTAAINGLNKDKSVIHFVVTRGVEGACPMAMLPEAPRIGATVAVSLARYYTKSGARVRVFSIRNADEAPSADVLTKFRSTVRVNNGMGFTSNDIFIPPNLISVNRINDGDDVEGQAVLSYDKKKDRWGWKAFAILSFEGEASAFDLEEG
ncbi:DUF7017 domain-containing protein [Sphingopyxis sp. A083]|uniref:DUF7017 domain-containing protein n=1 Tax=Sphingopyxis sp. A083 TaxID=1759083 RepID=UPI0007363867|nr:hypothetical protein [Sphingopyxis sp. A083]KTE78481.1 hypothetical protein ATE59_01195 [Sphingopyxis sp. A083]